MPELFPTGISFMALAVFGPPAIGSEENSIANKSVISDIFIVLIFSSQFTKCIVQKMLWKRVRAYFVSAEHVHYVDFSRGDYRRST